MNYQSNCRRIIFAALFLVSNIAAAQTDEPVPTTPPPPEPLVEKPKAATFDPSKLKGVDTSTRRELSEDEINQQFFKKKQPDAPTGPVVMLMPVFYERMERALAKIKARVTPILGQPSGLEVDGHALTVILQQLVSEEAMKQNFPTERTDCPDQDDKKELTDENICWKPYSVFQSPEIKIDFDESALEIHLRVPPELRAPRTSSFFKYGTDLNDETDTPSYISSFVNINASQSFRSNAVEYQGGREPLAAHFDSGTRLGPIVIDANGRYLEQRKELPGQGPAFTREDVRAVLDFPSLRLRAQAGDVIYPVKGYQTYRGLAGGAVFTQFSLLPSQLTLPGGNYELFLTRPSKIFVYINDQMIQVLDLPAGKHNLRDFPFSSGLNDIRLEIVDDMGRSEEKHYTYFSSNELLRPGLNEISYAGGAPWTETNGERSYDSQNNTYSFSHRVGVTQSLTLGANYQMDSTNTLAGLETLFSTDIGYFSIEPAYSTMKGTPYGYAAKLRYLLQDYEGPERRSRFYGLEVNSLSSYFTQLGGSGQPNISAVKVLATHNRSVSKEMSLSFGLGYQFSRDTTQANTDSYNLSAGLTRRWSSGFTTNLNFRHTRSLGGREEITMSAFLVWSIPKEHQYVSASHDSSSASSRADWTYQPTTGVGGFSTQLNTQKKQSGTGYGGTLDYVANRARLSATHQVEIPAANPNATPPEESKSINTTNLRIGTAIVFASGRLSLSRPVTDSFAILSPLSNLKGQNVKVNPQSDGTFVAQTDWLGSAVDPEIPSYSLTGITLGNKDLKPGTALPRDHFYIKPTYHSGYFIKIGSNANVYLETTLVKPDGAPVPMIAAQVVNIDDPSEEAVTIFTNREGLVRSEGFHSGKYRIEFSDGSFEPYEFEIPESAGDQFKMPPVQLKPTGKGEEKK